MILRGTVALALVVALGCTTRVGDLTIATPKNLSRSFDVVRADIEGEDCYHMLLFIPLGSINPSMEGAIDDALESVPEADAMTNARFQQSILFTLLYNQGCYRVRGDAVRTR
jgi:hypothetical protein